MVLASMARKSSTCPPDWNKHQRPGARKQDQGSACLLPL